MLKKLAVCLIVAGLVSCGGEKDKRDEGKDKQDKRTYAQNLLGGLDRTTVEKTRMDMNAIHTALEAYSADHGAYPTSSNLGELVATLSPTYIRSFPRQDAWNLSYVYSCMDGRNYTLTSLGIDGTRGTKDDIELSSGGFTKLPHGYTDLVR